jgi:hypothetical protein
MMPNVRFSRTLRRLQALLAGVFTQFHHLNAPNVTIQTGY